MKPFLYNSSGNFTKNLSKTKINQLKHFLKFFKKANLIIKQEYLQSE